MRSSSVLVVGVSCALASCSTLSVEQAGKLASAGREAAAGTTAFLQVPRERNGAWIEGSAFAASYPLPAPGVTTCNRYGVQPIPQSTRTIAEAYYAELDKTARFMGALDKAYSAYAELVAYDARGEFNTAYDGLVGAAKDYIGVSFDPGVTAAIGSIGGLVQSERQKARAKQGSERIRRVLEGFAPAFRAHQRGFTGLREQQVREGYQHVATLWCAGLLDARPLIAELATGYGLAPLGPDPVTASDPQVNTAIAKVLEERSKLRGRDVDQAFEKIAKTFDDLIVEHRKVEAGQAADIGLLTAQIAELRQIVEAYSQAEPAS